MQVTIKFSLWQRWLSNRFSLSEHASCHCHVLPIEHLICLPIVDSLLFASFPFSLSQFVCICICIKASNPAERQSPTQSFATLSFPFTRLKDVPTVTNIYTAYTLCQLDGAFTRSAPVSSA